MRVLLIRTMRSATSTGLDRGYALRSLTQATLCQFHYIEIELKALLL